MFTNEMTVNPKYKYIDKDISCILGMRLSEENLGEWKNIFTIAPIGEKESTLVTFLYEEKTNNAPSQKRTLLIPYLTGGNKDGHWVGIVVKFENNIVTRIEYYDSLVRPITDKLVQDLMQVYGDDLGNRIIKIQDNFIQQDDISSCGPCMIENLVNAAKQAHNILPLSEIRKNHILLTQNDHGSQDFYERQQNDHCAISRSKDTKKASAVGNKNKLSEMSNVVACIKQNDVPDHYNNEYCFPRCEYKYRFEDTSAFRMLNQNYWNTYFRSTPQGGNCDRIANLVKSGKTFKNSNINKSWDYKKKIPPAKSGCIKSPWVHDEYKKIFYSKPFIAKEIIDKNNGTCLYDQLLQYKASICSIVVERFIALTRTIPDRKIDVYFENDYPCIMVQIKDFAELCKKQEQGSLYKIVIAYFITITNYYAYNSNIPIELLNRASFGHNIPSVSDTTYSFRISIGIVPKAYAEVLAKSLELLNNIFLVPLLNKKKTKTMLGFSQEQINNHNVEVASYNKKKGHKKRQSSMVDDWQHDDSLLTVLCKVGDSSGRKVSHQITRCNKYIDLLANYAHQHFFYKKKPIDFGHPFQPLRKILTKLTYQYHKVDLTIDNSDYYHSQFVFRGKENEDIQNDKEFWDIIQNMYSKLDTQNLSHAVNNKKIKGLYKLLEKVNLEFIRNSNVQKSEDGYGSSSDCEVSVDDTKFFSRKITVSTGMRAINLAQYLSIYQARPQKIDTEHMYYETGDVIHNIDQLRNLNLSMPSGIVKFIDLNHCAAKGPNCKVDLQKIKDNLNSAKVIVFDYTSATTEKISEAIRLFVHEVKVLLLVSSGIKNEQIGADMNPYGTLRIIATDYNDLNKLYYTLKFNLISQEKSPNALHNIRKMYKDAGATVTSAAIYIKNRGYDYQSKTFENDSDLRDFTEEDHNLPDALKKITELFSSKYEDDYINLTKTHNVSLNSIISWHLEKIEFLGSDDIIDVIERFDDNQDIFNQITECYDSDHNLATDILNEIRNSEADLTDWDFESLAEKCKNIQESYSYDDEIYMQGENIIDIIVNEDKYDSEDYRVGFALFKRAGLIDSDWSSPSTVSSNEDRMLLDEDIPNASNDDTSVSSLDECMDYEA